MKTKKKNKNGNNIDVVSLSTRSPDNRESPNRFSSTNCVGHDRIPITPDKVAFGRRSIFQIALRIPVFGRNVVSRICRCSQAADINYAHFRKLVPSLLHSFAPASDARTTNVLYAVTGAHGQRNWFPIPASKLVA